MGMILKSTNEIRAGFLAGSSYKFPNLSHRLITQMLLEWEMMGTHRTCQWGQGGFK